MTHATLGAPGEERLRAAQRLGEAIAELRRTTRYVAACFDWGRSTAALAADDAVAAPAASRPAPARLEERDPW